MKAIRQFIAQWDASVDIDPVQHVCTALVSVILTLLLQLLWASVRGFL